MDVNSIDKVNAYFAEHAKQHPHRPGWRRLLEFAQSIPPDQDYAAAHLVSKRLRNFTGSGYPDFSIRNAVTGETITWPRNVVQLDKQRVHELGRRNQRSYVVLPEEAFIVPANGPSRIEPSGDWYVKHGQFTEEMVRLSWQALLAGTVAGAAYVNDGNKMLDHVRFLPDALRTSELHLRETDALVHILQRVVKERGLA
ncbi:hypothetical protein HY493_04605 [Candidatus Woesearchaeota archaeon]|nr:hypothetical protein [Candidatus Woesearchaeota archaeon]